MNRMNERLIEYTIQDSRGRISKRRYYGRILDLTKGYDVNHTKISDQAARAMIRKLYIED